MSNIIKFSDASNLALHSMAYLVSYGNGRTASVKEIAEKFDASEAHLSKVIQRLSHSGLVKTQRGPGGGVTLAKKPEKITLLEIYESIEGPLSTDACLLGKSSCRLGCCILGETLEIMGRQFRAKLAGTKLSDFNRRIKYWREMKD